MTAPQTAVEALADSVYGLDHRIAAPLDEVPALRRQWAEALVERLQARGFTVVAIDHQLVLEVALSAVGGSE